MGYYNCPDGHRDVVCLCGSTRFKAQFEQVQRELTHQMKIVLTVGSFPHADAGGSPEQVLGDDLKQRLDKLHLRKIDMAEEVYVIDPGGYIGTSTAREIAHAEYTRKPVRYWSKEKE